MYPTKLDVDKGRSYFYASGFFVGEFNYVHAYLHDNYSMNMHSHEFYEMNIITAGHGRHYIGETSIPVSVGDVFVIPPEIAHGYYSEDQLDVYHVLIKSDFFERYAEELSHLRGFSILFDIEPHIRRSSGKSYVLNVGAELKYFKKELEAIICAEENKNYIRENSLTMAFIGLLCERITDNVSVGKENGEILKIMEYIKENVDKELSCDTISAFANMSRATLNRRFRDFIGMSPMSYVTECRINRARELVLMGEYSKAQVAQMCGFYDTAHLNKYYKKRFTD